MDRGVIYVAGGAGYLELAVASAESLRAVEPDLAVDLFTDGAPPAGLFDAVHPLPGGRPVKIAAMAASRFARTLYLDCDTLVVQPLGDLWEVLDRFDLALCHDVRRASALIREGFAETPPYAFPQLNAGVVLYRRGPAMAAFFADWARRYREAGVARDQVSLRDLLWASDLRFWVLPPEFNLRRVTVMDAWEPLDAIPTIIHSHRLLQHLRGKGGRVRSLPEILRLEREALAAEWAAAGLADRAGPGEDPAARFVTAQGRLEG